MAKPEPTRPTKTISLTVDHVFLPSPDPEEDNVRCPGKGPDGKRLKYRVAADIADLLVAQDRAMEVPD